MSGFSPAPDTVSRRLISISSTFYEVFSLVFPFFKALIGTPEPKRFIPHSAQLESMVITLIIFFAVDSAEPFTAALDDVTGWSIADRCITGLTHPATILC